MLGKPKPCKYCGQKTHTSLTCRAKPRKAIIVKKIINRVGPVTAKWIETRHRWIQLNPPDQDGYWTCYLHISPFCPSRVDIYELTLDHVKSRSRHPELRFDLSNLKPACGACNELKGSRDLEEINQT